MVEATAEGTPTSTRVFVSGLPPKFTSDDLRKHFSEKHDATDAHVLSDRRIGFVGFRDHDTAQNAVRYFNKSFIRMSKIAVSIAKPVDVKRDATGLGAPISQRQLKVQNKAELQASRKRKRDEKFDGDDQCGEIEAKPAKCAEDSLVQDSSKSNIDGEASEGFASDAEDGSKVGNEATISASDSDWLRAKTSRTLDLQDPIEESTAGEPSHRFRTSVSPQALPDVAPGMNDDTEQPQQHVDTDLTVTNGRLFVRNLAFDVSKDELGLFFGTYGKVTEVHVVKDNRTSKSRGLGFVQFFDPEDAAKALLGLDGQSFQGRLLHVLPASDKKDQKLTEFEISKLPLKQQKAFKRKAEAATSSFSWNSLYMNPDAVLSSTAERLGVSKAALLGPSSTDAAVKQAHAETAIIQETKDYLQKQGLNIDAFSERQRDDRSLLLKNFMYGTTSEELTVMLGKYGSLERLVFPPSGTMAIAQFHDPYAAKSALKDLAYSNMKGSVLYLEKAPQGLFDAPASSGPVPESKNAALEQDSTDGKAQSSTIFIRNLNFATSTARLSEVFKPLTGFMSARVKTRTEKARPGEILSMGFGFAEFRTKAQADAAIATMNGHRLDGHELLVQLSNRITDAAEERRKEDTYKKADQAKTKIIIKNLPFEASKKDLRGLFGAYGQLRSIRMPRKFDNSARGFAFADFVTAREARSAMEALSHTHLLGRKLVLDFAEGETDDPEETIQAMEKKAGRHEHLAAVNQILSGSGRKKFAVDSARDEDA